MTENIPLSDAKSSSESADVVGVIFDRSLDGVWRGAAFSAAPEVVENDLPMRGQRRQSRPEHSVIEDHSAVDRDERRLAGNRRCREHREIDSAGTNRLAVDSGRAWLRSAERDETFV